MEAKLKSKIKSDLKELGAYVVTNNAGAGVPGGCPDLSVFYRDRWAMIEVKASEDAPFRPGQKPTLEFLGQHNQFVYVVFPENWDIIKEEMITSFF